MRIAVIAHSLYPIREPFAGGLEMITHSLCSTLQSNGHIVHLYAHKDSDDRFEVRPLSSNGLFPRSILLDIEAQNLGVDGESLSYISAINTISAENYDIVHNHSLHHIPILMGNLMDAPVITTIHTPPFTLLKIGAYGTKGNNRQIFTMVSRSLHETWKSIIPNAEIIYNGIDLNKWSFNEFPKGDYLFWYGRICPEKGTVEAIEAAIKSNCKLILAGPINNKEYFEDSVESLLENQNISYVGHLSQMEVGEYLSNAQLMLFTSLWEEPYGLTLAESLGCGTPVVAFEGGATQEILTHETGVVVPKHSIYGLVKAIHKARNLSRRKCRERAVAFCSSDSMIRGYTNLYESLLTPKESKIKLVS
ncbi:hypothetical protein HME9304_00239 [Flagellimonas maritima]|uniref:Glycosyltransferase family 4 protein n=1 Tax=Flagellimonas maritima TaxID=1383885 RepID=A0A2Z4LN51_9FLAO|nr:glycosyltransferase [Allomuricauda aurantiaca]AWX43252.1 hypothetical protein HME9304_00239 [Allomuricauda aurantiaca]